MNIFHIGDIVGKLGRSALKALLKKKREEYAADCVIANAENAAGGSGLTAKIAQELLACGCDVLTLGDHVWDQKDMEEHLKETDKVVRPANFPEGTPGRGWTLFKTEKGISVAVVNVLGRTFMRYHVDCPFRKAKELADEAKKETPLVCVELHAEATSEKGALGHYLDGEVSSVVGSHTHIQTADEKILSKGTAFITDLGMTGPCDSVIGQDKENIIKRFLSCRPIKFNVASGDIKVQGVFIQVDEKTGQAGHIERISWDYKPE